MTPKGSAERIQFIDMGRFGTMALVFCGHFIERTLLLKNPPTARRVPQLVGKPKAAGPLIAPLFNTHLAPFEPQGKGSDCHVYPKV